jgi:hypothetical protein
MLIIEMIHRIAHPVQYGLRVRQQRFGNKSVAITFALPQPSFMKRFMGRLATKQQNCRRSLIFHR